MAKGKSVEDMTVEQVEALSSKIGESINRKLEKPLVSISKLLEKYGLEMELRYNLRVKDPSQKQGDING